MMVYLENPRNLPKSKEKLWELINELSKAMDTQYVKKKNKEIPILAMSMLKF